MEEFEKKLLEAEWWILLDREGEWYGTTISGIQLEVKAKDLEFLAEKYQTRLRKIVGG